MKRFLEKNKKIILGILIGILFSGVGVYAATTYLASDVTYTPSNKDWNVDNVKNALDDLYSKNDDTISFGTPIQSSSQGPRIATRTTSITLNKGKYIVSAIISGSSMNSSSASSSDTTTKFEILCDSNSCNYISLSNFLSSASATTQLCSGGGYNNVNIVNSLYYIEILKDNTVLTGTKSTSEWNAVTSSAILQAIPIK